MSSRVDWSEAMEPLGRSVVAIGVFDGVHAGHRALLAATVAEARRSGALAVACTFDHDPDRIIHPEAAAPELLTLPDRLDALASTGIDVVMVVPFTSELAALSAEEFLDSVLGTCCTPVAIHVGEGFRFGAGARGDLDTLYVWGVEHNAEVRPHPLVLVDGEPVSATRIRALVARGDVRTAAALLERPPRVRGTVHHGRGAGADIGFATANMTPEPYSALPADGVYAGRAILESGEEWPAAISVGTPPTFPQATDYVEAHLIGYWGDLYGTSLALEFLERLRPQESFGSATLLSEAIAGDVRRTLELVAAAEPHTLEPAVGHRADRSELLADALTGLLTSADEMEDGTPVVEDPLALEAAERAVAGAPAPSSCGPACGTGEWVTVFGPSRLSSLLSDGGSSGALIAGPLADANIPFMWSPFAPELAQSARPDFNFMREFSLMVPAEYAEEARTVLRAYLG